MSTVLPLLADEHGLFLRKDALAAGLTDQTLIRAVRNNTLERVRHGAYMPSHTWESLSDRQRLVARARAVVRQAQADVVLSHSTAAVLLDAPDWGLDLSTVHVTRSDRRGGRSESGVRRHRGELHALDVCEIEGLQATSATRTALDVTRAYDVEHALPIVDHLLHSRATTKAQLAEGAERMRTWSHTLATDLVVRLADGRHESVGESRVCFLLWRAHLPKPIPQYPVRDDNGRVIARVDFAWPEYGVFLEFDGRVKYAELMREGEDAVDVVLREKRREELICELTGWICIRLTWADLERPQHTVQRIRSALDGRRVHR